MSLILPTLQSQLQLALLTLRLHPSASSYEQWLGDSFDFIASTLPVFLDNTMVHSTIVMLDVFTCYMLRQGLSPECRAC